MKHKSFNITMLLLLIITAIGTHTVSLFAEEVVPTVENETTPQQNKTIEEHATPTTPENSVVEAQAPKQEDKNQVEEQQDFSVSIEPTIQTYSDYPETTEKIDNSHSEAKNNAGLNQIVVNQGRSVSNYKDDNTTIIEGKIVKTTPTVFTTLGGANRLVPFYNTLDDAINRSNPVPISGASYDGWYLSTTQVDDNYYANVIIGGLNCYVNVKDIQIIPSSLLKARSYYQRTGNDWTYYEANDPITSDQYTTYDLGNAPSQAVEGTKYVLNTSEVYQPLDGGVSFSTFNYFQNLPGRATTSYTAQQFQSYLAHVGKNNSQYYNATSAFIDAQNHKGVNALLLFAMANHESYYGTSYYARTCYNFYGRGAYDSDPDQACKIVGFPSAYDGAAAQAYFLSNDFFDALDWRYYGSHPGDKTSGMNVKYASDPAWGAKLAAHMQEVDNYLGNKDYNRFSLALSSRTPIYTNANLSTGQLITGNNKPNQQYYTTHGIPVIVTNKVGSSYAIQLDTGRNTGSGQQMYAIMANHGGFPNYEGASPYGAYVENNVSSFCVNYTNHRANEGYVSGGLTFLNHQNYVSPSLVNDPDSEKPLYGNTVTGPIAYSVYQNGRWLDIVGNNTVIGDVNSDAPITALTIDNKIGKDNLPFRTHVSYEGWKDNSTDLGINGSDTLSQGIEAIQIDPEKEYLDQFDVYYRVHSKTYGWMDWAKNGNISGSYGKSAPINAIHIKVVHKADHVSLPMTRPYQGEEFLYQTHAAFVGWSTMLNSGQTINNPSSGKQLEAIRVFLPTNIQGGLNAWGYSQNKGWIKEVHNGEVIGTVGQSLRLEAYELNLTGNISRNFDIAYRSYVDGFGWTPYTSNSGDSGSQHMSAPMLSTEVSLVTKGTKLNPQGKSLVNEMFKAKGHVQDQGWQQEQYPGMMIGTEGQELRMEAIEINNDLGNDSHINYQAHVQYQGWQPWKSDGQVAGTTGQGLRMEAIRISLTGSASQYYDVYYQAHVQYQGWQEWVKNGAIAGTTGQELRLEALRIKIVLKSNYQNVIIRNRQQGE